MNTSSELKTHISDRFSEQRKSTSEKSVAHCECLVIISLGVDKYLYWKKSLLDKSGESASAPVEDQWVWNKSISGFWYHFQRIRSKLLATNKKSANRWNAGDITSLNFSNGIFCILDMQRYSELWAFQNHWTIEKSRYEKSSIFHLKTKLAIFRIFAQKTGVHCKTLPIASFLSKCTYWIKLFVFHLKQKSLVELEWSKKRIDEMLLFKEIIGCVQWNSYLCRFKMFVYSLQCFHAQIPLDCVLNGECDCYWIDLKCRETVEILHSFMYGQAVSCMAYHY